MSRNNYLKRTYGITEAQYDELLKRQKGKCYVCKRHHSEFPKRLSVDHDHSTLEIRGLLCTYCNRYVVGRWKATDSTKLRRMIKYINQGTGWYVPRNRPKRRRRRKTKASKT